MLAAAMLLPPIAVRIASIRDLGFLPGRADGRGFLGDVSIALLLAAIVIALARWRFVVTVLAAAWVVANFANYEHLGALGAMANLARAGELTDATFMQGSVLAPTHPLLSYGVLVVCVGLAFTAGGEGQRARTALLPLGGAAVALAVWIAWPSEPTSASWRQTHFVYQNAKWSVDRVPEGEAGGDRWLRAELGPAAPRVEPGRAGTNVLLVMLEGVSGGFLEGVARHHGVEPVQRMTRLDRLARGHLSYTTFLVQQQQTNHGVYAMLCGDPPKLLPGTPKMTEIAREPGERRPLCLPAVLQGRGYATAYVQSAPLAYMHKDRFMPRIGFEAVHGDSWFDRAYARDSWGVDDRAFFEQSLAMVERLDAGEKPWFLTLLTSGTHHPYRVPPEEKPAAGASTGAEAFAQALGYLDRALDEFVVGLERLGILDDTVVIVTSDESYGLARTADDTTMMLAKAWGLLVVMLPAPVADAVDEPFVQMDLPLSVLDYLGYVDEASGFAGRSVFRQYPEPRPLVFGNLYMRRVAGFDGTDRLHVCEADLDECEVWATPGTRLFSPQRTLAGGSTESPEFMAAIARGSLVSSAARPDAAD
jgi:arylsulfatase A-like enzyme